MHYKKVDDDHYDGDASKKTQQQQQNQQKKELILRSCSVKNLQPSVIIHEAGTAEEK